VPLGNDEGEVDLHEDANAVGQLALELTLVPSISVILDRQHSYLILF